MTTETEASYEAMPNKLRWTQQSWCSGEPTPKRVHLFEASEPETSLGQMYSYRRKRRRAGTIRFPNFSCRFSTWDVPGLDLVQQCEVAYSVIFENSVYYRGELCPKGPQETGLQIRGYVECDGKPFSWLAYDEDVVFIDLEGNVELVVSEDFDLHINLDLFQPSRYPVLACGWILAYSKAID